MKNIFIATLLTLCIAYNGYTQNINGASTVSPNSWETYYHSLPLSSFSSVSWFVNGGTIAFQDNYSCTIIWGTGTSGTIDVYEDIMGGYGSLSVQIGSPTVTVTPNLQNHNYGNIPTVLDVASVGWFISNYQWEESSDNITWNQVSGAINPSFQPGTVFSSMYYRCLVGINGTTYYSDVASVILNNFEGGTIYLFQAASFNSVPIIGSNSASGGLCYPSSYLYEWEASVAGGPWFVISTGRNFTATNPIIADTRYRRKVVCAGQSTYSNTIEVTPTYTFLDDENRNYIREYTINVPNIVSIYQADLLVTGDKLQSTNYLDGLGRSEQIVSKEVSSINSIDWFDYVQINAYDGVGREDKKYLPHVSTNIALKGKFKTNAITEQENYIRTKFNEPAGTNSPTYQQMFYDDNPLNVVQQTKLPGYYYAGNPSYQGRKQTMDFNNFLEQIKIWDISVNNIPVTNSDYVSGTLYKKISTDENSLRSIEYYDFDGKLILKKVQEKNTGPDLEESGYNGWVCTYNVYDEMDRLRFVITPKAVNYLISTGWVFNDIAIIDELCFVYQYDAKSRKIVEHSPGGGYVYNVYDKRNRLVLSQDENQRGRIPKQWSFRLYDDLDREKASGLFDNNSSLASMQTLVNNLQFVNEQASIFTGVTETIKVNASVIGTGNSCNNCTNIVINTVNYFNNYSFSGAMAFSTNYSFPSGLSINAQPTQKTDRVYDLKTGSKVRVLNEDYDDGNPNNDLFLVNVDYYDDNGRPLQNLANNIKNGIDVTTTQYNFDGRVLALSEIHNIPGNGSPITNFPIVTYFTYDKIGRVTALFKKYHTSHDKKIKTYDYDELGAVKRKTLSPDYNGGNGLEKLDYDYNMYGSLIGINKDYALSNSALTQWNRYFGMHLGYENRENFYTNSRMNGQITGIIWKTQGDNTPRKYNYEYDHLNRLTAANFTQKESPNLTSWLNTKMDFSVTNITYDVNGNLTQMYQKGIIPGVVGGVLIDKLNYSYKQVAGAQWTNKLDKVYDNAPYLDINTNGSLGDFKDETYGVNTNQDYEYDANGNLVKDNNKKIRNGTNNGIKYNFLDKVQTLKVDGKYDIEFIYSATGQKIAKKVTNLATSVTTKYWYINQFLFEETSTSFDLQYIMHEEGRVRVFKPVTNTKITFGGSFIISATYNGVFEFDVKDNLQSTRMVLTEEIHNETFDCGMELGGSQQNYEEENFGELNPTAPYAPNPSKNQVIKTRSTFGDTDFPTNWNTYTGNSVSKVGGNIKIGPNLLLKVMGGDDLKMSVKYYYASDNTNYNTNINLTNNLLSIISSLFTNTNSANIIKDNMGNIQSNLSNGGTGTLNQFFTDQNNTIPSNKPKAFLNYIFFDENFNFIPYDQVTGLGSYSVPVTTPGNGQSINIPSLRVPKNGYAYIYVSNASISVSEFVFFDDFIIEHRRGQILQENAYYAYGLKIKGISAKAISKQDSKFGYQGSFSEEDTETGWNEFDLRNYDPQIGRWSAVDPYDEFPSGYVGMGNNPANFVDRDGGSISAAAWNIIGRAVIGGAYSLASNWDNLKDKRNSFWKGAGYFLSGAAGGAIVGAIQNQMEEQWRPTGGGFDLSNIPKAEIYASILLGGLVTGSFNALIDGDKKDPAKSFVKGFANTMASMNIFDQFKKGAADRIRSSGFNVNFGDAIYQGVENMLTAYGSSDDKTKLDFGDFAILFGVGFTSNFLEGATKYGLSSFDVGSPFSKLLSSGVGTYLSEAINYRITTGSNEWGREKFFWKTGLKPSAKTFMYWFGYAGIIELIN